MRTLQLTDIYGWKYPNITYELATCQWYQLNIIFQKEITLKEVRVCMKRMEGKICMKASKKIKRLKRLCRLVGQKVVLSLAVLKSH